MVAEGDGVRRTHWFTDHDDAVPQVVDAVTIPVIAAGGIADGRGMGGRP